MFMLMLFQIAEHDFMRPPQSGNASWSSARSNTSALRLVSANPNRKHAVRHPVPRLLLASQ